MTPVTDSVRIGILGDLEPASRGHKAINDALQHAAAKLKIKADSQWIPTPSALSPDAKKMLESFDGLWAAPGSPYKSFEGMLKGIEFARRRDNGRFSLVLPAEAFSTPSLSAPATCWGSKMRTLPKIIRAPGTL